jgi:hypothetical protein
MQIMSPNGNSVSAGTLKGVEHAILRLQSLAGREHRKVATASYRNISSNSNLPYTTAGTDAGRSRNISDYLRSPFDLATFGPRLLTGVLLSGQEVARDLPVDIEKASTLLQGPGPQSDKQEILAKEVETRLARYLQKGATVEAELLTAFTSLLPEDVKRNLPAELKDILLRGSVRGQVAPTPPTYQEAAAVPIAVVAKNQTAAEMEDLRGSVAALRVAIADLNANTDPAQTGVLKVIVRDARASLALRLQRLTPPALATSDVPLDLATREAKLLLQEAEAMAV